MEECGFRKERVINVGRQIFLKKKEIITSNVNTRLLEIWFPATSLPGRQSRHVMKAGELVLPDWQFILILRMPFSGSDTKRSANVMEIFSRCTKKLQAKILITH